LSEPHLLREDATVLVTGSTSQLGRLVVAELLGRGYQVRALVRRSRDTEGGRALSEEQADALADGRLQLYVGDVLEPDLGLGRTELAELGDVTEIIHLARPRVGEEAPPGALVRGLDGVVGLARRIGRGRRFRRLLVLSTTAVAGEYHGRFYEDWLEVGQSFSTEEGRSALELEIRARESAARVPVVVSRHALLVGHSTTGASECDAGLGRLFAMGPTLRRLPAWAPVPGAAEGPRFVTVSPVDYVAAGIVVLACAEGIEPGEQGATFCLADGTPPTLGELTDLLLDRVGGPEPLIRLPVDGKGPLGMAVEAAVRAGTALSKAVGRGPGPMAALLQRGEHDVQNAERVLEPFGVACPRLATYLDALYTDYLQAHDL